MVTTWKIVFAAVAIFAAGVITGGITTGLAGRVIRQHAADERWLRATNSASPSALANSNEPYRGPGAPRINQVRTIIQSMDLGAAQTDRLRLFTHESEEWIRETWEPIEPRIQRELRGLENRIAKELSPEKRSIFRDALRKKPWELRTLRTNGLPNTPSSSLTATNATL